MVYQRAMQLSIGTLSLVTFFGMIPGSLGGPPAGPPDYSHDPFPPYPSLTEPPTAGTLGARLFGWVGCNADESKSIAQAYDDMYHIARVDGTYKNIDWAAAPALEFFGPNRGKYALTDDVHDQIQQIFQATYEVYSTGWGNRPSLWIRVRCSSETGDPNNICRDRSNNGSCPGGRPPTPPSNDNRLEAYSDPNVDINDYSQITFCTKFFNDKRTLAGAIEYGEARTTPPERHNLQNYDNRGRVFFHEVTHLDYFMNAPSNSPYTDDLRITFRERGFTLTEFAYGATNAKILGKYRAQGSQGYYTQRNADTFAFFALSRYVQGQIGDYPSYPRVTKKPTRAPRNRNGDPVLVTYDPATAELDGTELNALDATFSTPGCGDKAPGSNATSIEATVDSFGDDSDYPTSFLVQERAWLANAWSFDMSGTNLRILPLGDSITYGFQSSSGNGYRQQLYNDLSGSNQVDMIGSVRAGTMSDNDNEGHSGATIDQIASFATASLPQRPNVILVHAGTNDMNGNVDPAGAPGRLANLVDKILNTCPDAAVLVAQIIPSGSGATQARIIQFNAAIPDIVASRVDAGHHVFLVDMFGELDTSTDYADDLHPNDSGYAVMGEAWYRAITYASAELGWINAPVQGTGSGSTRQTCNVNPVWIPQGEIANGAGLGKNAYPSIICNDNPEDANQCECINSDGTGIAEVQFKTGSSCADMGYDLIHAVHFADLNGDGRAEYLWVDENGAVTAFLNLGAPDGPTSQKGATVGWLPSGVIASGVGARRHQVQFADLNGDGRAEYLWVHPNGSVEAWLNLGGPDNGPNAAKVGWLPQGMIASGIGEPGSSIVFADLNGDGRAEYLSVAPNGAVTAYLNLGPRIDSGPHAAVVGWLPQGVIATGVGALRNNTVFADINGDGRADYLDVSRGASGAVSEWKNGGGPDNGPNAAKVVWYPQGSITGGDGTSGTNVMFADLNGDGRAEYIEVNPDTSAVTVYLNGCPG